MMGTIIFLIIIFGILLCIITFIIEIKRFKKEEKKIEDDYFYMRSVIDSCNTSEMFEVSKNWVEQLISSHYNYYNREYKNYSIRFIIGIENMLNNNKKQLLSIIDFKKKQIKLMNKNKKTIYGYCGVMGSGKNYRAEAFLKNNPSTKILSYAGKIRELIGTILGADLLNPIIYEEWKKANRGVMDRFSENLKKEFGEDIWVRVLEKEIENCSEENIIITDVRFPMEINSLMGLSTIFTFSNYKSDRYEVHPEKVQEILGCKLIEMGYNDGDVISYEDLNKIIK